MILAEYIWIDADQTIRSKTRTLFDLSHTITISIEDIPVWNFDGSSTRQAESGIKSEVNIVPVRMFVDPFRRDYKHPAFIVLCECIDLDGKINET